ncbi:MAG: hypothetical protein GX348_08420 [Veillonellaceae bacterium]|jgi:lactoylglutathione lyase|nr:hypothetical protein [Veillonellaceae bacterium]
MYEVAHIGVVVKDAQLSSKFYCDVLGCEVYEIIESTELKLIMLKSGSQIIELVQYFHDKECERGAGIVDHIAFIVPNMDLAVKQLARHNVPLLQDKPKVLPDKKIMFFSGPDGERLEFIEILSN